MRSILLIIAAFIFSNKIFAGSSLRAQKRGTALILGGLTIPNDVKLPPHSYIQKVPDTSQVIQFIQGLGIKNADRE